MSPVSPVCHSKVTVSIGLKTSLRIGTSIPQFNFGADLIIFVEQFNELFLYLTEL